MYYKNNNIKNSKFYWQVCYWHCELHQAVYTTAGSMFLLSLDFLLAYLHTRQLINKYKPNRGNIHTGIDSRNENKLNLAPKYSKCNLWYINIFLTTGRYFLWNCVEICIDIMPTIKVNTTAFINFTYKTDYLIDCFVSYDATIYVCSH